MKYALWILPVLALAQTGEIQDGLLVRITSDQSVIAARTPLRYPREAMANLLQGTVIVKATLDPAGRVRDVAVVSGPAAFRDTVVEAVKQWRFVAGPAEQQVSIEFRIPSVDPAGLEARRIAMEAQVKGPRPPRKPLAGRTVKDIMFLGIPEAGRPEVLTRMAIKTGDVLANENMDRAEEELRKLDPKIQFKVLSIGDSEAQVILFRPNAGK